MCHLSPQQVLGWSAFPEQKDAGESTGNFGLQDQRLAMNWASNEATSFGGDSTKVTIFGESAGGMSVMAHLVSPRSKGLFQGAISQSGWPQTFPYSVAKAVTKDVGTDTILAPSRRCSGAEAPKTVSMLVSKLNRLISRNTDGVHRPPQYPLHISLSLRLSLSLSQPYSTLWNVC